MPDITETWASDSGATITEPTVGQQTAGFTCGPADPGLFNWLFNRLTDSVRNKNANGNLTKGTIV